MESVEEAVEITESEYQSVHAVALRLLPAFVASNERSTCRELVENCYRLAEAFVEERDRRIDRELDQSVEIQEESQDEDDIPL